MQMRCLLKRDSLKLKAIQKQNGRRPSLFNGQKYDVIWRPFCFLFFGPLCSLVCWRVYFPNFVLFISFLLLHFNFWASLARFFSLSLPLFFFRIIFNAWRVGDGDVITHRRRRRRLSRNFTHRPFSTRYFRFIYISKAFVEKIPKRKCRQKAVALRRVDTLRCQSCVNYAIKLSFTRFRAACRRA